MRLALTGHDYRYAVEQILMMMYPGQRPDYSSAPPGGGDGLSADVALHFGGVYASAVTRITSGGAVYRGTSRVRRAALTDRLVTDRLLQRAVKLSFFKAAAAATGKKPAWGALTGIRPGKIVTELLERGFSERAAARTLVRDYFVSPERAALCTDTARAARAVKSGLGPNDIALYVGIPFCPSRCHYCSFVSHSVEKSMKLIEPFLEALLKELLALSETVRALGLRIIAVYIGGGTPTTLSAGQLSRLMDALRSNFDLRGVREYTVEAGRPDTITAEKLHVLIQNGVTRLSVNPQTMDDGVLRAIGRRHTAEDVLTAYGAARGAGFADMNMDLIAGLPGDTAEGFIKSLDSVLTLGPENITVHTLALKKGARVTLDKTDVPDGAAVAAMLDYAGAALRSGGYIPYYLYRQKFTAGGFENTGWCRPGHEGLYNVLIMEELTTILSAGGGGVTKLVGGGTGAIERLFNYKYPYEYIDRIDNVIGSKAGIHQFYSGGGPRPARGDHAHKAGPSA